MGPGPLVFATRDALMHAAADELERALMGGQTQRGHGYAALSGGATPEPAYARLARRALNWPAVTFGLVDERFVPPTHSASNEAMLRRALAPALSQGARIMPLFNNAPTLEQATERADLLYAGTPFDVAIMGMGEDGHTASWFTGGEGLEAALDPANTRTVVGIRAPQASGSTERLTLTFAAIQRIACVRLIIAGHDKNERLADAFRDRRAGPVAELFKVPGEAFRVFYAD